MAAKSGNFPPPEFEAPLCEAPVRFTSYTDAFPTKTAVFRTKSSTGKQTVQRTAAALYAKTHLEPHQSLAAADGSGHHLNHKKLRGGSHILSDNARNHLNGYRLSVPQRWLYPLSSGTVSEQICLICFDPFRERQAKTDADFVSTPLRSNLCSI